MDFKEEQGQIVTEVDGKVVGSIKFRDQGDRVLEAYSTFVDDSQRGQGLARQLVDQLVAKAEKEGKKIKPSCSYVESLFQKEKETYGHIEAE